MSVSSGEEIKQETLPGTEVQEKEKTENAQTAGREPEGTVLAQALKQITGTGAPVFSSERAKRAAFLIGQIRNSIVKEISGSERYQPEQGKAQGKNARKTISRTELGKWDVRSGRKDKIRLIFGQEKNRVQELLPVRHERMSASPFAFLRGAAVIMASDLAESPTTGIRVQACGDAHIANFGIFASPERHLVFDLNDFDETLPAPWEWDVKRMMASIEVCGRDRNFSAETRTRALTDAAAMYRDSMRQYSSMSALDVWYDHVDMEMLHERYSGQMPEISRALLEKTLEKALAKNREKAVMKYTEMENGQLCFRSDPPRIVPVRSMLDEKNMGASADEVTKMLGHVLKQYRLSLPRERRYLVDQYVVRDAARKVVGVGSVGTRCWLILLEGGGGHDTLVLQIKEANDSVLEPYAGKSEYLEHGRRVVEGLRAAQTYGDILTGWARIPDTDGRERDYYVRQYWDYKGAFDLTKIEEADFAGYCALCARILAHAHAKTGNRHAIAGYIGKSSKFTEAMIHFAEAYADQNEEDYKTFLSVLA